MRDAARGAVRGAALPPQGTFSRSDLEAWLEANPGRCRPLPRPDRSKVFGIGLSRTGTRSLNAALQVLGCDTLHYPADRVTFDELGRGCYDLSILRHWDGITDITAAPFFAQLDRRYPGAKFILTVRDEDDWIASARNHWQGRSAFAETHTEEQATYMEMRRLLRAATYGCYDFNEERFRWVYEQHRASVLQHFRHRPESLLVLDICAGGGWAPLSHFLGCPLPTERPFPHRGSKLTRRLQQRETSSEVSFDAMDTADTAPRVAP